MGMLHRNGPRCAMSAMGSRADLATRLLMPPIFVRTSPDSRHEGDRLDDLRSVPGADTEASTLPARRAGGDAQRHGQTGRIWRQASPPSFHFGGAFVT